MERVILQLKQRSDLHLERKLWHLLGVGVILAVQMVVSRDTALALVALAGGIFITLDVSRLQWPQFNKFALKTVGIFMREHERSRLAGTTWLFIGAFIIIWFFSKPIVSLTLAFLAVADPLASYVGILHGRDKLVGAKSLQGATASFVACALITWIYLILLGGSERTLLISLLSGLIGALSELVPVGKLDDNLTFPVISATLLDVLFRFTGGPF